MFSRIRWLLALLVCLVAIGLWRGWFSFTSPSRDPENERLNINVSVDTAKVKKDAREAKLLTEKVAREVKERRAARAGVTQ